MRCKWTKLENHPVTVVEMAGEISSERDLEILEEIAEREETQHIALLMQHVTYINSRGIGVLVHLKELLEKRDAGLFLVSPIQGVVDVITVLGGEAILQTRGSLESVIREVGS